MDTWSPVYTPLYCISHVVFICFMSSLICAHAATDSDSSSMCTIILFPVLMSNIHFRFFLILLVTFEVSSHKWGWYNSTKVYHPNWHQLGKAVSSVFISFFFALSPIMALGLAMMGSAFISIFLDKSTYTTVLRCNLLPLMLKNCIISPKSTCSKSRLWENCRNALACSSLLVSKNVRSP